METTSQDARIRSYGPKFKYDEFMVTKSKFSSLLLSFGLAFAGLLLMIPPVRIPFSAQCTLSSR